MTVESECIVCHIRQVMDVCDFINADEPTRQSVLKHIMQIIINAMDDEPEEGVDNLIHQELKKIIHQKDPYVDVKKKSIKKALEIYPRMVELADNSVEPLKTLVELCIAGNVIDFGPSNSHDIEASITEVSSSEKHHFDFLAFSDELNKAKTVLVLGDNAGETVFDRILMERLTQRVFYSVKSEPILNDALMADALDSGISACATIIENGSGVAGTFLPQCSQEFLHLFHSADMVISKGMANFETLVNEKRRIFFLFKVKCGHISRKYNLHLGEYVLIDNQTLNS